MSNKAVPTALKMLRGNPGRRKPNRKEPKPQPGAEFPAWLDALGDPTLKAVWEELAQLLERTKVLTESDAEALAQLTHKIVLYRTAANVLRDGMTYETITESGATMQRQKPEYAMLSDLGKQIRGLLTDFGLTPSSRTKVQTVGPDTHDPILEFLGPSINNS